MKPTKFVRFRFDVLTRNPLRPNRTAAIAFCLVAVLSAMIIWRSEFNRVQIERARVLRQADDHAHAIQFSIERVLSATYSLAVLVRQGGGDIKDFGTTGREMLPFYPGASSFQLAPGGVVRKIVPLAGNENAIDHDLLKDPARTKEAFLARDTGKLTLAGPFNLIQGGIGAVGRLPVFMDDDDGRSTFWGFVVALIRFPDVLESTHLFHLSEQGLQYTLWRIHPDTGKRQIISGAADLPAAPVNSRLELPNGNWTLSVAPSDGWGDTAGLWVKIGLGLIFSLLVFFLIRTLLQRKKSAVRIAQKLTKELRGSEIRYRSLVTSMADGICMQTPDGKITAVNPAAVEILGRGPEQVLGKTSFDSQGGAVHEDGSPFPEALHPSMVTLNTGVPQTDVVMGFRRPDGSLVWLSVNSQPIITDGEVAPSAVVTTFHDITDRKLAAEALARLNRQLLAIGNCNRVLIQAASEQELLEDICRIICEKAGYRMSWIGYAENDAGKTIRPVAWAGLDSGYVAGARLSWGETSQLGKGPAGEAIRSGKMVRVQDIATDSRMAPWREDALRRGYQSGIALPLREGTKGSFGVLLIYSSEPNAVSEEEVDLLEELSRDLTFGIIALRTREALLKSEERLRREVALMPIGYIVWDEDFRIVSWNPAAETIFGFTFDEVRGRHPRETIIPAAEKAQVDRIWSRLLAGKTSIRSENINLTRDGRHIVCEWTNAPLRQHDGTVTGAISMVHDITERRLAQEKIQQLNQELEHRVRERTFELSEKNDKLKKEIHERCLAEEALHKAKAQLEKSNLQLEALSVEDALTGLANRRRFDAAMAREHARHARSGGELSLIMFDIDHFKAYNDRYGHLEGDNCLRQIAEATAKSVERSADIAARYGGEEFACILPETGLSGARILAERIRSGINRLAISHQSSPTAKVVTASFGVATAGGNAGLSVQDIIALADKLLYRAKEGGRNRIEADIAGGVIPPVLNKRFVELVWQDTFCSGNHHIDTQHRNLFSMSNELLDAIESSCSIDRIAEMATRLLEDIARHFHDEEAILESIGFPDCGPHAREHARLLEKGGELGKTLRTPDPDLDGVFRFLTYEVVFQHMRQWDREFFPFFETV